MSDNLSEELLQLIAMHIDSVETLEVLLFLQQRPERSWSLTEIDTHIRSNTRSIENRASRLVQLGFVLREGDPPMFRYHPTSEELRRVGAELLSVYTSRRVEIVELIYAKPMKEIISFSTAFVFGKGGKKGG